MNKRNPFVTTYYVLPEYFCNREIETTQFLNVGLLLRKKKSECGKCKFHICMKSKTYAYHNV